MKILVTGSEGYIGSVLMPKLYSKGYEIVGYDIGFYKKGLLTENYIDNYKLIRKDIRDIQLDDLKGFDAVIHLAALSNDPLGHINEDLTYEINHKASVRIAKLAKKAGVKRFVFASSCSLYGASDKILTEKDLANPQTAYGKSKILAEEDISKLADENFSPTFMRNATAFGISPRMRFDIVVNNLTGFAKTINEIKMLSDGTAYRPLVHVSDICDAMICTLEAETNIIHNQAFNVGDSLENYQIKEIAKRIKNFYSLCEITLLKEEKNKDTRNYNVSFEKLNTQLKYKCKISLEDGIKEIKKVYDLIKLDSELFSNRYFTRLNQIKYLLDNNFIDMNLRTLKGYENEF